MPATTSTHTGAYGTGFRAWVHVSTDYLVPPAGYEVMLMWNPTEVQFVGVPDATPRPAWVSSSQGIAAWIDVNFASAADFELHFRCASGFTGSTTITGVALKAESYDGHKSQVEWTCGSS